MTQQEGTTCKMPGEKIIRVPEGWTATCNDTAMELQSSARETDRVVASKYQNGWTISVTKAASTPNKGFYRDKFMAKTTVGKDATGFAACVARAIDVSRQGYVAFDYPIRAIKCMQKYKVDPNISTRFLHQ